MEPRDDSKRISAELDLSRLSGQENFFCVYVELRRGMTLIDEVNGQEGK